MRSEILAARAIGVSAAKLAQKYGVSTSYIYMVKE
jgi:predicted DNA-binding transcriptional regulator YafY